MKLHKNPISVYKYLILTFFTRISSVNTSLTAADRYRAFTLETVTSRGFPVMRNDTKQKLTNFRTVTILGRKTILFDCILLCQKKIKDSKNMAL